MIARRGLSGKSMANTSPADQTEDVLLFESDEGTIQKSNKLLMDNELIFSPKEKKILIAEDMIFNIKLVEGILKKFKIKRETYVIAMNGREVVDIIKEDLKTNNGICSFKLILMDCQMPIMDGYEATEKVRELTEGQNIRIIAITGHQESKYLDRALDCGMDTVHGKPFHFEALSEELFLTGFITQQTMQNA